MAMKKIQPAMSVVLAVVILAIPSGFARASLSDTTQNYVEQQQVQGIINGLTGISDAINAQTKALQIAQKQQQIASLDQTCVNGMVAQINAKDKYIKQVDQMIDEYTNVTMKNMDMSNPVNAQQANSYLNYLFTLKARQNDLYFSYILNGCANYKPQVQQTAPTTGTQCNGKSWNACPTGQRFYCPATGDAQCVTDQPSGLQCNGKAWSNCPSGQSFFCPTTGDAQCKINEVPVVTMPVTSVIQPPAQVQKQAVSKAEQVNTKPTTETGVKPQPTVAPTIHAGLIPRFWAWFTSLLGL
jgi:hypothetical protein